MLNLLHAIHPVQRSQIKHIQTQNMLFDIHVKGCFSKYVFR